MYGNIPGAGGTAVDGTGHSLSGFFHAIPAVH